MPSASSQSFLKDLDKKLWSAADRLRANLDAAVYSRAERDRLPEAARRVGAEALINHAVLGLIFLKYVSDSFAARQREIEAALRSPANDYYLDPDDYGGHGREEYEKVIREQLEERDYYIEKNVFWVPASPGGRRSGKDESRMMKEKTTSKNGQSISR